MKPLISLWSFDLRVGIRFLLQASYDSKSVYVHQNTSNSLKPHTDAVIGKQYVKEIGNEVFFGPF